MTNLPGPTEDQLNLMSTALDGKVKFSYLFKNWLAVSKNCKAIPEILSLVKSGHMKEMLNASSSENVFSVTQKGIDLIRRTKWTFN